MKIFLLTLILYTCVSCGSDETEELQGQTHTTPSDKFVPEDPYLAKGYLVWKNDCIRCHKIGMDGAPKYTDQNAWKPRLAKGRAVLYQHAIEGWFAPSMAEMPARGGNPALSDDEVKSAVDYMLWAAIERNQ